MPNIFYFNRDDLDKLRRLIDRVNGSVSRATRIPALSDYPSTDVYIAYTNTIIYGLDYRYDPPRAAPGEFEIFRITEVDGDSVIESYESLTKDVYNVGDATIYDGQYVLIYKTKSGHWITHAEGIVENISVVTNVCPVTEIIETCCDDDVDPEPECSCPTYSFDDVLLLTISDTDSECVTGVISMNRITDFPFARWFGYGPECDLDLEEPFETYKKCRCKYAINCDGVLVGTFTLSWGIEVYIEPFEGDPFWQTYSSETDPDCNDSTLRPSPELPEMPTADSTCDPLYWKWDDLPMIDCLEAVGIPCQGGLFTATITQVPSSSNIMPSLVRGIMFEEDKVILPSGKSLIMEGW